MWLPLFLALSICSMVKPFVVVTQNEKFPCTRSDWTFDPVNCYIDSQEWQGQKNVTENGLPCQPWEDDYPHRHGNHDNDLFPDNNEKKAGNQCRDPDNEGAPWCYTQDEDTRWEFCGIPKCEGDVYIEDDICTQCYCQYEDSQSIVKVECEPIVCPICPGRVIQDKTCCGVCDMSVCVIDDVVYEHDEELPSEDPCHICKCVADGKEVGQICEAMVCPACHGKREDDASCCGECIEGCMVNNTFYEEDEQFQDGCSYCQCHLDEAGPYITCVGTPCAINCDPHLMIMEEGDCCPKCQPGCYDNTNGQIYEEDDEVPRDSPCEQCHCRQNDDDYYYIHCVKEECLPCEGRVEKDETCCGICHDVGCVVNGTTYNEGDDVPQDDPCAICTCFNNGETFELMCAHYDCAPCPGRVIPDDSCCGKCEPGCFDGDEQFYPDGINIPSRDPCVNKTCRAPEIAKSVMACEECVGRWTPDDTCCGKCEYGCLVGDELYPDGADVRMDHPCEEGYCHLGQVVVYMMACAPCQGRWTDDQSCCGLCEPGCEVDGVLYENGQNVPMSDPCAAGFCENGEVQLLLMGCPPCPGYTERDDSCCGKCVIPTLPPPTPPTLLRDRPSTLGGPISYPESTVGIMPIITTKEACDSRQCPKLGCKKIYQFQDEGMCCPQCKCKRKRDRFLPGPVGDKCSGCVCDGNTGDITCTPPTCPANLECVDPVIGEDCCYHCPNGKNCVVKGKKPIILAYGEFHRTKKSVCACGGDPWYPYAFCADIKLQKKPFKDFIEYFDEDYKQLGKN